MDLETRAERSGQTGAIMERVFLCTPLRGSPPSIFPNAAAPDPRLNLEFARKCMTECLARGQAPFAPHLLYPQVLDDNEPKDRALGVAAGREWLAAAEAVECYVDRGVSDGMRSDLEEALRLHVPVNFRTLAGPPPSDAWLHFNKVPHTPCVLCKKLPGNAPPRYDEVFAKGTAWLEQEKTDPDATLDPNQSDLQQRVAEASRLPGDPPVEAFKIQDLDDPREVDVDDEPLPNDDIPAV